MQSSSRHQPTLHRPTLHRPTLHRRFTVNPLLVSLLVVGLPALSLLAGCRPVQHASSGPASAASSAPAVSVSTAKTGDTATVKAENGRTVVDVTSASGIGSATLTWPAGAEATNAPTLVINLHTKGLEELRLKGGDAEVIASVSSSPPYTVRESLSTGVKTGANAQPQPIDERSPYWVVITLPKPAAAGTPAIPLQAGAFEIIPPPDLLTGAQGSLEMRWIDFYR